MHQTEQVESVVVRFAGDSGDGMQLTGTQFTMASVLAGNDIATFPDFPAEIRAPAGTLAGVSGFQLHFSSSEIFTPGDAVDVLVAMNPAALAKNLDFLRENGVLIVNRDSFNKRNLKMAGFESNPLDDEAESLEAYQVYPVDLARLTKDALAESGMSAKEIDRSKNFFALGLMCWLYERDVEVVEEEVHSRFGSKPKYLEANLKVLRSGYNYGENSEQFLTRYHVPATKPSASGTYRNIQGNEAIGMGLICAAKCAQRDLFLGSYPITPASDILHYLSKQKHHGVYTFQAEDEIAAVCAAIGAAWGNQLAVTTTSGPGMALKGEAMGLAVITELPLVIINVQRGGPSTGLPTKTEQADLLQTLYGRNGESPLAVLAARSPGDAFEAAYEAARIAMKFMVPVVLLSDGAIANGAEPWRVPDVDELPQMDVPLLDDASAIEGEFEPYRRDPETLARPWPVLGTPGLEHRLGGIEKWDGTGHISYDPDNHHHMTMQRQERVDRIAHTLPATEIYGEDSGDVLMISWGSTYGACVTAVRLARSEGHSVSHIHLRWLNPMPLDLGGIIDRFNSVLVPEMNNGQLFQLLRSRYLFNGRRYNRIGGVPLRVEDLRQEIVATLTN
ncbi:MAG TPA: 2-oxoglutarate ferredoxin oxidoreductase subunit alpha [Myxococcales bacterium]|nr:2-oxoglutarate ferredoxin oxidoreductase subunit alpha [Myxococcales bacterium]HAN32020.1 2-oxoglutarate ferredoxin oxidoreductase subunit alpha [Myxococcales bacterium]